MNAARAGIGLPAILAVLAVSAVVSIGVLTVALQRGLDAHDAGRRVRVTVAAESAVRIALAHWDADTMRAIPVGSTRALSAAGFVTAGDVTGAAVVERLDTSRYLVRGEATIAAGGAVWARASALATVVMVPTDGIWQTFYSTLASAGDVSLAAGAVVSGTDSGVPAGWSVADCPPGLIATVTALLGSVNRPGAAVASTHTVLSTGASVAGQPPIRVGAPLTATTDFDRLGALSLIDVALIADRIESGTVTLAPVLAGGVCDTNAPGNWGDPANPTNPCFAFVPLIHATGSLEVASGGGQGILVVEGDLVLRPGAEFTGLILATGQVDLDGARVTGAVRAGSDARIDGTVAWSSCAIGRILDRVQALRKPFRLGDRLWLPGF